MDFLTAKMSVTLLKRALESLPSTLNQLYDEAFRRIDDQNEDDKRYANRALRWVAYAYRPLTIHELEQALIIEPEGQCLDLDATIGLALVIQACAGLLVVDLETQQVRLVHYTAQDYFDALSVSRYRDAHTSLARDCITYLNYDEIQHDDEATIGEERYYFLEYALEFWAKHCKAAGYKADLEARIFDFLIAKPRIWCPDRNLTQPPPTSEYLEATQGITVAACYGFCDLLRRLLQENQHDIDEQTFGGFSALHLAAGQDEVASIDLLLEYGADIDCLADYNSSETPLMMAIQSGSIRAASLLVERGADVMIGNNYGDNPFTSVFWESPIPFLQLLLSHGADVNSRSEEGTQLIRRAKTDDLETARWLLEQGAIVDIEGNRHGQTALSIAAEAGSTGWVEFLLGHGADIDQRDRDDRTLLMAAIFRGAHRAIHALLDAGAKVDLQDREGCTALHYAVVRGDISTINVLRQHHADFAQRSLLDLALTHVGTYQGRGKPRAPFSPSRSKITFLNAQELHQMERLHQLQYLFLDRGDIFQCRLWKGGMTALDIAVARDDVDCIGLLEPLTCSRTECTSLTFTDYLYGLFGFSSIEEGFQQLESRGFNWLDWDPEKSRQW